MSLFNCVFDPCEGHHDADVAILHGQQHLAAGQIRILTALEKLMTASEDLKAAVTAEDATVEGAITAIVTYLQDIAGRISGGLSDEDAAALTADINEHAANLSAATANLVAVDPGAPAATDPTPVDGSTDGSGDGTGVAPTE